MKWFQTWTNSAATSTWSDAAQVEFLAAQPNSRFTDHFSPAGNVGSLVGLFSSQCLQMGVAH